MCSLQKFSEAMHRIIRPVFGNCRATQTALNHHFLDIYSFVLLSLFACSVVLHNCLFADFFSLNFFLKNSSSCAISVEQFVSKLPNY